MREEIEILEHEADLRALSQNGPLRQLVKHRAALAVSDQLTVDAYRPGVHLLQMVQYAQQRRLT
ncbi:Uncharacterised protein [Mycobacteroides abscessus subsp. abscessus]|nr:Uncharacterised protein [Mycobacteroides abscessus subsp. abscessus]